MVDIIAGQNCTGCAACQNACSLNAIDMKEDTEGFWYPSIDNEKCVKCQKCVKCCPVATGYPRDTVPSPTVYAAWHTDEDTRIQSTSGGVFTALAQSVLDSGGYVVGACYGEHFVIHHDIIHSYEDIVRLRQSKYAQSWIGTVYRDVRALLKRNETVLFCGTPCQVAGLKQYLQRTYTTLYCCDFICRGVISPKVYRHFLKSLSAKFGKRIQTVQFKNKDFGWNQFSTKITFEDGTIYQKDRFADYYMCGYLKHNLYLRPSCYQCRYKELPRVADISLGDFWKIGLHDATLDNNKGTSVVLVNSSQGQRLMQNAQKYLVITERTIEDVVSGNACLLNPATKGPFREYFFKHLDRMDFISLIERIEKKSNSTDWNEKIKRIMSMIKNKFICRRK